MNIRYAYGVSKKKGAIDMATKFDVTEVARRRASGESWTKIADGDTALGIAMREALYRLQVANGELEAIKPTGAQIRRRRDAGEGWALIAARASISVGEAKKLLAKDGKSAHPTTGRIYRRANGEVVHSPGAAIVHRERNAA